MSDLGRETRAYVSGYDRSKVQQSRMYRFEKRSLIANFNGALAPERLIECVTWRTDSPEVGVISNPLISADRRETSVSFASQLGGWANIRVDATLDNGEIYTQVFRVNVREASWFFDDPPTQAGPFSLTTCFEPPTPPPPACDLDFIAEAAETTGVSTRPGAEQGTVISTSPFLDSLGTEFALVTLGPGFIQLIFNGDVAPNAFFSMTVTDWPETFVAVDATYNNTPGVDTFFSWFTNVNEFLDSEQYCVTFVLPS